MPYPNSQSPVTLRLGNIFSNPPGTIPTGLLNALVGASPPLGAVAENFNVAFGPLGKKHIDDWPLVQQELVRQALILAIGQGRSITFDWQIASSTSTTIIDFPGQPIGITFRSPLVYPPYTGP